VADHEQVLGQLQVSRRNLRPTSVRKTLSPHPRPHARFRFRVSPQSPPADGYGYFQAVNATHAHWFWNTTVAVKGSNDPTFSDEFWIVKSA